MCSLAIAIGLSSIEGRCAIVTKVVSNTYCEGDKAPYIFVVDNHDKMEKITQHTYDAWDPHQKAVQ